MDSLSLTRPAVPDAPVGPGGALAPGVAATVAVAGLLAALYWSALWPLALGAGAALLSGWLALRRPLVPHVEYFSANEDGLRYVHGPGEVAHYKWTEIRAVSAHTDGGRALLAVHTGRGDVPGATVHLPMPNDADCRAASAAAARWLAAYRL